MSSSAPSASTNQPGIGARMSAFVSKLFSLSLTLAGIFAACYFGAMILALMGSRQLPEPEDALAWTWMFPVDIWRASQDFISRLGPTYDQISPYHNFLLAGALAAFNAACNSFAWWVSNGLVARSLAQLVGLAVFFVLCGGITGLVGMLGNTIVAAAVKAHGGGGGHH
jgi:hypothetical protein